MVENAANRSVVGLMLKRQDATPVLRFCGLRMNKQLLGKSGD
jgi:hypothetical protein